MPTPLPLSYARAQSRTHAPLPLGVFLALLALEAILLIIALFCALIFLTFRNILSPG